MSVSYRVSGDGGKFRLIKRNYSCQGMNPDYEFIANLTDEEANALLASGLISPLGIVERGEAMGNAADYLTVIDGAGDPMLQIDLPQRPGRPHLTHYVPGVEDLLRHARRQPGGLRALASRCGAGYEN